MAPSEHPPIARLRKLRAVELRVPTLTESADFYAEVWGLEVVDRDQDTAWLRGTGDEHHILGLTRAPATASASSPSPSPPARRSTRPPAASSPGASPRSPGPARSTRSAAATACASPTPRAA